MARFGLPVSDSESDADESEKRSDISVDEEEAPPQSWIESDHEDDDATDNDDEDESFVDQETSQSSSSSESVDDEPVRASASPAKSPKQVSLMRQGDNIAGPWPKKLKLEPKRVAVMQASFFHQPDSLPTASSPVSKGKSKATSQQLDWDERATPDQDEQRIHQDRPSVPKYKKKRAYERVAFSKSILNGHESMSKDPLVALSRSFRAGWGPRGIVLHLDPMHGRPRPSKSDVLTATSLINVANSLEAENEAAQKLLEAQLKMTTIDLQDSAPFASPDPDLRFRHFLAPLKDERSNEASTLLLASALFDEIEALDLPDSFTASQKAYAVEIRRRQNVDKWLSDVVSPRVEEDLRRIPSQGASTAAQRVFALLSGHQIARAASAAMDNGDLRLATVVAQAGGDDAYRQDLFLQLAKWREYRVDAHIDLAYRRVYELLSGNVGLSEGVAQGDKVDGAPDTHISEGLDWKRVFGLHLWYGSFKSTLDSAVERYEAAVSTDKKVAAPLPPYIESPDNVKGSLKWSQSKHHAARDPAFQLLKIYTSRTFPIEDLLMPQNFGTSPLDYRLPWHFYVLLSRVLRIRDFGDRVDVGDDAMDEEDVEGNSVKADLVTEAYASQLEQNGMWEWAIFVLLHLELPDRRERAIRELLCRSVDDFTEESLRFVTEDLKVPSTWIYAAQALDAKYEGDVFEEYKLLVQAQQQNEAHELAAFDLAPETIIRNDFDLLRRLFEPFNPATVRGWENAGQIYLDFADCLDSFAQKSKSNVGLLKRCLRNVGTLEKSRPDSFKIRLAVSEMRRRLTLLAASIKDTSDEVRTGADSKADRLVVLESLNESVFADALRAAGAQ